MELLDCALIGICAVIRSNTVFIFVIIIVMFFAIISLYGYHLYNHKYYISRLHSAVGSTSDCKSRDHKLEF